MQLEMLKLFLNKTGNRFVDTGNLPVIGLRDVMCQVAAVLERKAAGEVKRGYVIDRLRELTRRVQCQLSNLG